MRKEKECPLYAEPSLSASVDRGYYAGPSETTTAPPDSAESDASTYLPTIPEISGIYQK